VHNGIDLRWFRPDALPATSPPIVVWIGRGASPLKRLDKFAAIAPALREAGFRLWVLDQHGVEKAAEVLPEAVRVLRPLAEVWHGVPLEEMRAVYHNVAASGGCVVSTSSREGFGLAFVEAQACGCVVVGPDVQGVNEAVSRQHGGVLYPFGSPADELASLVIATVKDVEGMRQRQAAAAAYVREHFSLERMAAQYCRLYGAPPSGAPVAPARIRARLRLSPLLHWEDYLRTRWGVGALQYAASLEFSASGQWRLAAGVIRSAVQTGPTLFANPRRFAHLVRTLVRAFAGRVRATRLARSTERALQQLR
jgi:hypothetical protein